MDLVTVAVANNSFNAHMLQTCVHADGRECYVLDENALQIRPSYSSIGGLRIQVKDTDVEAAVVALRAAGYATVFDVPQLSVPEKKEKVYFKFLLYLLILFAFLLLLYLNQFGLKLPNIH